MAANHMTDAERQAVYDAEVESRSAAGGRVSELTKYIWAGGLAIFFTLATADARSAAGQLYASQKDLFLLLAIFSSLAVVSEFGQHLFGYLHHRHVCEWIRKHRPIAKHVYNTTVSGGRLAMLNNGLFNAKLIFSGLAGVLLTWAIAAYSLF